MRATLLLAMLALLSFSCVGQPPQATDSTVDTQTGVLQEQDMNEASQTLNQIEAAKQVEEQQRLQRLVSQPENPNA